MISFTWLAWHDLLEIGLSPTNKQMPSEEDKQAVDSYHKDTLEQHISSNCFTFEFLKTQKPFPFKNYKWEDKETWQKFV